ncbi:hypothetical protein [Mucilaginibacter antarcticus]|uniref:Uncharacterized protein n=1 Tax=Mucilaginibacter antarcticus TaxID=1855725 RepID=A0ABW5XNW2_9SPHI
MQITKLAPTLTTEVFKTTRGAVYQNDAEKCWYVDFAGNSARFDYRNLLKLRKAIYKIDIEQRLLDSTQSPDVEIVFICASAHCYVLNLMEVIAMKELLQGTFVMLELNQIIYDRLHRLPA